MFYPHNNITSYKPLLITDCYCLFFIEKEAEAEGHIASKGQSQDLNVISVILRSMSFTIALCSSLLPVFPSSFWFYCNSGLHCLNLEYTNNVSVIPSVHFLFPVFLFRCAEKELSSKAQLGLLLPSSKVAFCCI